MADRLFLRRIQIAVGGRVDGDSCPNIGQLLGGLGLGFAEKRPAGIFRALVGPPLLGSCTTRNGKSSAAAACSSWCANR